MAGLKTRYNTHIDRNHYALRPIDNISPFDYHPRVFRHDSQLVEPKTRGRSPGYQEAYNNLLKRSEQARAELIRVKQTLNNLKCKLTIHQARNAPETPRIRPISPLPKRASSPVTFEIRIHKRPVSPIISDKMQKEKEEKDRLERERLLRYKREIDYHKEPEITSEFKILIHGASANSICNALLKESDENNRKAKIEEEQFVSRCMNDHKIKSGQDRIKEKSLLKRPVSPIFISPNRIPLYNPVAKRFYENSRYVPRAKPLQTKVLSTRYPSRLHHPLTLEKYYF